MAMAASTDAFFLDTPFQTNELQLAHIVVRNEDPTVFLSIGALGEGFINSGDDGGAAWEGLAISIPEPASGLLALCSILGLAAFRRRS